MPSSRQRREPVACSTVKPSYCAKVQRYKETHDGRHPKDDDVEVLAGKKGGTDIEFCIVPMQSAEEWEYEVVEGSGVKDATVQDDGSVQLSAQQMDNKAAALASRVDITRGLKLKSEEEIAAKAIAVQQQKQKQEDDHREQAAFEKDQAGESSDGDDDGVASVLGLAAVKTQRASAKSLSL